MSGPVVVEVFADVGCPFTHLGLLRFVERREELGRDDVRLRVRAWPLELVNHVPLDPSFIAEEVDDLRRQVAPERFVGFDQERFPRSSLPALRVAAAANRTSPEVGERVSLALRDALFERGEDIADPLVLHRVAKEHGVRVHRTDGALVLADHAEGVDRGVIGSPHFFTPGGDFFCPALDVSRDEQGQLHVLADPAGFDAFLQACFEVPVRS